MYQSVDLVSFLFSMMEDLSKYCSNACNYHHPQGNLQEGSDLAENMPNLMKLKAAIYSPEYRSFVERLTGLEQGTLTDEVNRFFILLPQ